MFKIIKRICLVGYTIYVGLFTFLIFASHTFLYRFLLIFPFKDKETMVYKTAIPFLRLYFLCIGIRVTIKGEANLPIDKVCIAVSNHQSHFDIILLMAYLPLRFVFLAKKELLSIPILGSNIKKMGHAVVDRKSRVKAINQLEKLKKKLAKNRTVIIFPEGTRSSTGVLKPFKRGAFMMAAQEQTYLLPLYIHGSKNIMKKNSLFVRPGHVTLHIGKQIDPVKDEDEKRASETLKNRALDQIVRLKKENAVRD